MTVPDNTTLHVSEPFTKTWKIKNVGTCTWTTDYKLVFVDGDRMDSPDSIPLPVGVAPGQTFNISVSLFAPSDPGQYQGFWQFQAPNGGNFGVGAAAAESIWAKVNVIPLSLGTLGVTPTPGSVTPLASVTSAPLPTGALNVTEDFVGNACAAQWLGNDGALPCPGPEGDTHGFVIALNQAALEDGTTTSLPALLTFPQASADGYIQGTYPEYEVKAGDHLQTTVSCEQGATACSVLYRISYLDASDVSHDLWTLGEFYHGHYFNLDLDLGHLAGQKVRFILSVSSLGSTVEDPALWVAPHIVNFPPPTSTAPAISTSTSPAPSLVPGFTSVPPTSAPTLTPAPTPAVQNPSPVPSIPQIIESILSFLRQLFGGQ